MVVAISNGSGTLDLECLGDRPRSTVDLENDEQRIAVV